MFSFLFSSKKRDRRQATVRLSLEQLEGRALPSTFRVLNLNDSGAGSLRRAVHEANAAHGADEIVFAPGVRGTLALTGGQLRITDDVTINGPGADRLTLSGTDASRVFQIGHRSTVSIGGLTFSNGLAEQGGAIFNAASATLKISHCVFEGNQAVGSSHEMGGGAIWSAGDVTITDTTFHGNQTIAADYGSGGAIANMEGTLTVVRCDFTDNKGFADVFTPAGAIDNFNGQVTIADSTFTGNQTIGSAAGAEAGGGALYNYNDSPDLVAIMTITNSTFIGNKSRSGPGFGSLSGAIHNLNGKVILNHSLFLDNQAISGAFPPGAPFTYQGSTAGGALFVEGGVLEVTDSVFIGNKAIGGTGQGAGGGAIAPEGAVVTITGSVFSGNAALGGAGSSGAPGGEGDGGAIDILDSTVTITNSTFTNNLALGSAGGSGAKGGAGIGGAIALAIGEFFGFPDASSLTLRGCTFENNTAKGGVGGAGGAGGDGWGGALAVLSQGTASLRDCTLDGNRAIGGQGRHGGHVLGGGIYVAADASVRVKKTEITHNRAKGGAGAPNGSDGQGIGGGVYNLGALLLDAFTVIKKNHASTSDDNVFSV